MATRISETIYFVRDFEAAIAFYTQKVGFALEQRYDWGFAVLSAPGGKIGIMLESHWDREFPDDDQIPRTRVAIQTDDFSGEIARLIKEGVQLGGIHGEPGQRQTVTFYDNDYNLFFLWSDPSESMA